MLLTYEGITKHSFIMINSPNGTFYAYGYFGYMREVIRAICTLTVAIYDYAMICLNAKTICVN